MEPDGEPRVGASLPYRMNFGTYFVTGGASSSKRYERPAKSRRQHEVNGVACSPDIFKRRRARSNSPKASSPRLNSSLELIRSDRMSRYLDISPRQSARRLELIGSQVRTFEDATWRHTPDTYLHQTTSEERGVHAERRVLTTLIRRARESFEQRASNTIHLLLPPCLRG